jgi:mercuric ion binding protein
MQNAKSNIQHLTSNKMKTIRMILTAGLILIITGIGLGQASKGPAELKIKSSVVCGMCKDRVENGLIYEKGVKEVTVDLEAKEVTVKYTATKTTPDEIRTALSKLGYDADDVKADPKAYQKLPACCKKDAAAH